MELELLKRKLTMLTKSGVLPENILRDLCVVARAEAEIAERLDFLEKQGVQRIMPWMIKCDFSVLLRYFHLCI